MTVIFYILRISLLTSWRLAGYPVLWTGRNAKKVVTGIRNRGGEATNRA